MLLISASTGISRCLTCNAGDYWCHYLGDTISPSLQPPFSLAAALAEPACREVHPPLRPPFSLAAALGEPAVHEVQHPPLRPPFSLEVALAEAAIREA